MSAKKIHMSNVRMAAIVTWHYTPMSLKHISTHNYTQLHTTFPSRTLSLYVSLSSLSLSFVGHEHRVMAAAKRSSSWLRGLFTRRSRRDEDEESEGGQEREYSDGLGKPLLEREDSEDEERKPEKESFEVGMAPSVSSSMALSEKNDAAEVIMRQLNFRILPTLFCFAFLIAVFQQNIKYSASGMIEDLEMDTQRFGAALSAFYLPSALLQLPTSMLAKRIGIKVYCAVLLTSWGIASLCMCFVRNFTGLMLLRFCLGCVSSGMNPVFSSYVSLFYGRSFAKAWARSWSLGMPVGNLLGGPLAATLLVITGRWEFLFAWQFLFLIWAVPFFLVGVLAATRFPTSPQHCHFLDEDEQLWLLSKTNAAQEDKKQRSGKLAVAQSGQEVIWKLMCDPRVICLSLSRFMRTIAVNGLNFYIPLILSDDGKRSMVRMSSCT